jgi:ABC-type branched-subunit amino acid transport system substrate-binding protein
MSIHRRTFLSTGLVGIAPAFFSAPARAAGVSDSEIVLGTHLDLAGAASVVTPPIRNGIQMRIDEANEAGGIHGRKLRLIVEDNSSLPPQAVRAVDKLIQRDGVFAIVCPFGSGPTVATAKRTVDAGVVCFGPYGASALVRQAAGPSPLLFTLNTHYDTTTSAGLKWAIGNFGSKRVGFIYQEGPFGDLVGRGVKEALAAKGVPLVTQAGYRVGDIDFSSQVARMRAADVDLIVTATVTRETIAVMAEVKKLGWSNVKVLTASPGRSGLTTTIGKDVVEGLFGVGSWNITPNAEQTGALKAWSDSYRKRFNLEADDAALNFYDYTSWFLQGVQAAGKNLTTEGVVKALQASSFKGQSSYKTLHFKDNHVDPEWIRVEQVEKGVWRPRSEVIDPASNTL